LTHVAINGEPEVKEEPKVFKPRTPLKKVGKRGKRLRVEDARTRREHEAIEAKECALARFYGCRGSIELHHILTKAAHPELRHDHTNLIWLCEGHHDLAHDMPLRFKDLLSQARGRK
jgi:hypothetical protein